MSASQLILLALALTCVVTARPRSIVCNDPDCGKNVTQLIWDKGYPCEDHTVTTEDGFVLSVQRIPHGRDGVKGTNKPVVFLQHGLLDASHTWVINFPEESLGFILADAGYDVWLGNSRGNTYSMVNKWYNPNQKQFWGWSFDEMAQYDLPAAISYITGVTGQSQIFYVGHSQGTMQAFAAFEDAQLAQSIKLFVALAPVAYVHHVSSDLLQAMANTDIGYILQLLGENEFLPDAHILKLLLPLICDVDYNICENAMCVVMGCDKTDWNATRWDVYAQLDPAGTSMQNMLHFSQGVSYNVFQKYDFGAEGNMQHYNSTTPPPYHLDQVACPMALFAGGNDVLADPTDVTQLLDQLPSKLVMYYESIPQYSHLDFVWGLDAHEVVYAKILKLFSSMV